MLDASYVRSLMALEVVVPSWHSCLRRHSNYCRQKAWKHSEKGAQKTRCFLAESQVSSGLGEPSHVASTCHKIPQKQPPNLLAGSAPSSWWGQTFIIHTYVGTPEIIFNPTKLEHRCFLVMFSHLSRITDSQKEALSGLPGILAFSSINIAGIWQGCCKLLPSSCCRLSCELLNAERIGTWQALVFSDPLWTYCSGR